jgi:hypothetical protein
MTEDNVVWVWNRSASKVGNKRRRQQNIDAAIQAVRKGRDRDGVLKIETEADLDRLVASYAVATAATARIR